MYVSFSVCWALMPWTMVLHNHSYCLSSPSLSLYIVFFSLIVTIICIPHLHNHSYCLSSIYIYSFLFLFFCLSIVTVLCIPHLHIECMLHAYDSFISASNSMYWYWSFFFVCFRSWLCGVMNNFCCFSMCVLILKSLIFASPILIWNQNFANESQG